MGYTSGYPGGVGLGTSAQADGMMGGAQQPDALGSVSGIHAEQSTIALGQGGLDVKSAADMFSVDAPSGLFDSPANDGSSARGYANFMMGFGAAAGAVGIFAEVLAGKDKLKSQAMTLEHKGFLSNLNARSAENDAQSILAAGRNLLARYTMGRGQEKSGKIVRGGARGVELNKGSMLEVLVTEDITKEVDMQTINMNVVADASRARTRSSNYKNEGLLHGVSAGNLRRQATNQDYNAAVSAISSAGNSVGQYAVATGAFG